jgi:hypothetical protein
MKQEIGTQCQGKDFQVLDLNQTNDFNRLLLAFIRGDLEEVKFLVDNDADILVEDKDRERHYTRLARVGTRKSLINYVMGNRNFIPDGN